MNKNNYSMRKIFTTGEIEIDQRNYLPNEYKKASSWAKLVSFNLGAEFFLKKIINKHYIYKEICTVVVIS